MNIETIKKEVDLFIKIEKTTQQKEFKYICKIKSSEYIKTYYFLSCTDL